MAEAIVYFNAPSSGQWGCVTLVDDRYVVAWPTAGTNYTVLVHDTASDTNTTYSIGASVLFDDAVVGGDGNVYAASATGTNVYKLNTSSWTVSAISYGATSRRWKLQTAPSGNVYGFPSITTQVQLLKVSVGAGTATTLTNLTSTGVAVRSSAVGADGNLYGVCSSAVAGTAPVIKIDVSADTGSRITPSGGNTNRYFAGLILASDGYMYAIRNGATNNSANGFIRVDTSSGTATIYSRGSAGAAGFRWLAEAGGSIYSSASASSVKINPASPSEGAFTSGGVSHWGILGVNGYVYAQLESSPDIARLDSSTDTWSNITGASSTGAPNNLVSVPSASAMYSIRSATSATDIVIKLTGVNPPPNNTGWIRGHLWG